MTAGEPGCLRAGSGVHMDHPAHLHQLEEAIAEACDQQTGVRVQCCSGEVCSSLVKKVPRAQPPLTPCMRSAVLSQT